MKYFEEHRVGDKVELGSYTFTPEAIKRFAAAFDPQPFHLDEEKAAESLFGGLCASGWHTASVWMRLMVEKGLRNTGAGSNGGQGGARKPRIGPSPGFDDMKWLKPVLAGQTISYTTEVIELRESRSKPEWGILSNLNEGRNEAGDLVISFVSRVFVERHPDAIS